MSILKIVLVVVLASMTLAACDSKQAETAYQYGVASKAFDAGDYRKTLDLTLPYADLGDSRAENFLGVMYRHGYGVEQNAEKAHQWFLRAAEQNNPKALQSMGVLYSHGEFVEVNHKKAFEYYAKSAELGREEAIFAVGQSYLLGRGVPRNIPLGKKLIKRAAEEGVPIAAYGYALTFLNHAQSKDEQLEALRWLKKGVKLGDDQAPAMLGEMYMFGRLVQQDFKKAAKYLKIASNRGNVAAKANLARLRFQGLGVEQDQATAQTSLQTLSDQGQPLAQYYLGLIHAGNGDGKLAEAQFMLSLKQKGSVEVVDALAVLMLNDPSITQDDNFILEYLYRASERGDVEAQYQLGVTYLRGERGHPQHEPLAVKWFEEAAKKGHLRARFTLAANYYSGTFLEKDLELAFYWYTLTLRTDIPFEHDEIRRLSEVALDELSSSFTDAERERIEQRVGRHIAQFRAG